MPIQFPPINPGDAEPLDGDTYLYLITQQEFKCKRRLDEAAQWSEIGLINTTSFGYRGTLEILKPAPTDVNTGNIYSVIDEGLAHNSFSGLAGTFVEQWSIIIFDGTDWIRMDVDSANATVSPWIRTSDGQLKPAVSTDDLNMDNGNYLINELPEL